jgi:hypothetical protein
MSLMKAKAPDWKKHKVDERTLLCALWLYVHGFISKEQFFAIKKVVRNICRKKCR